MEVSTPARHGGLPCNPKCLPNGPSSFLLLPLGSVRLGSPGSVPVLSWHSPRDGALRGWRPGRQHCVRDGGETTSGCTAFHGVGDRGKQGSGPFSRGISTLCESRVPGELRLSWVSFLSRRVSPLRRQLASPRQHQAAPRPSPDPAGAPGVQPEPRGCVHPRGGPWEGERGSLCETGCGQRACVRVLGVGGRSYL